MGILEKDYPRFKQTHIQYSRCKSREHSIWLEATSCTWQHKLLRANYDCYLGNCQTYFEYGQVNCRDYKLGKRPLVSHTEALRDGSRVEMAAE